MKTKFYYAFAVIAAMTLSACESEDEPQIDLITFEGAQLAEDGTLQGTSYKANDYVFDNYYYEDWAYNSGYTVSNCTDRETEGFMNQYSVYAEGGALNSNKFLIYNQCANPLCYIHRADSADFLPKEVAVALTTYTCLSTQKGDAYAKKFDEGDFFKMNVQGIDAEGNVLSTVPVKLIDFPTYWQAWKTVDLTPLGKVNKIFISFESSDVSEYGVNTPQYVALDNFKLGLPNAK